jgi:hypothetical protein
MSLTIKRVRANPLDWSVLALVAGAWLAACSGILGHRIFVTNDSLSNYAHVWYVADVFWNGGGIPFHFPELGHGDALAFPYGFLPWFSAALLRPLFGDWVVTLWLVLGGAGVVASAIWAFPALRKPLPAALLLANPLMVESVLLGQLPFLWAVAPWFLAIGLWRRDRLVWAVVLAALAQAGHPAVVLPLAGLTVLVRLPFEPHRWRLFVAYTASVVLAGPAIVLVLVSPVVEDSTAASLLANFLGTVILRAGVVLAPFAIIALMRLLPGRRLAIVVVIVAAFNVALVPIRDTGYAWHALGRVPDTSLLAFIQSPAFEKGRTYRILRVADGKVGMYQLLQHGARLDSEFFPESIDRRNWADGIAYETFLAGRHVDEVLIYHSYDDRYRTNEHALLDQLVSGGCASLSLREPDFDLYSVAQCR